MYSLNKAQILGNLTRDVELRTLPSGQAVASFAVATNRRYKDKDGNVKEDTQYHEVVVWGKLGELASQMLSKGKKVYVEGRLQTNSWEGTDGQKRSRTEIIAENFIPLSPKGTTDAFSADEITPMENNGEGENTDAKKKEDKSSSKSEQDAGDEINLDDIPF